MTPRPARFVVLLLTALWCGPLAAQETQEPAAEAKAQEPAPEPDRVVLNNGDVLTGTIVVMGDGKLTLKHPMVGDLEIKFDDIQSIATGQAVTLKTKDGEVLKRRVTGIENGELQLADPEPGQAPVGALPRAELAAINPPEKKPPQWEGTLAIGVDISAGNTDSRNANLQADAQRRGEKDRITAQGFWLYDENKDNGQWNLVDRILRGMLKYDYFLTEKQKLYLSTNAAAASDDSQNIELRFTMGGGLGYQWFETEKFKFFTEATVQYFNEQFDDSSLDNDRIAGRLASGIDWKVNEDLSLLHNVQYFPSLEDKDDLYLIMITKARYSFTKSMFAQAQWIFEFDNTPNTGNERIDDQYLLQVGYSF